MSMSTNIYGIVDRNKLDKAIIAKEALNELGVEYPDELDNIIDDHVKLPVTAIPDKYSDVWEIDLKDIPKNVTKIRFENNY